MRSLASKQSEINGKPFLARLERALDMYISKHISKDTDLDVMQRNLIQYLNRFTEIVLYQGPKFLGSSFSIFQME